MRLQPGKGSSRALGGVCPQHNPHLSRSLSLLNAQSQEDEIGLEGLAAVRRQVVAPCFPVVSFAQLLCEALPWRLLIRYGLMA